MPCTWQLAAEPSCPGCGWCGLRTPVQCRRPPGGSARGCCRTPSLRPAPGWPRAPGTCAGGDIVPPGQGWVMYPHLPRMVSRRTRCTIAASSSESEKLCPLPGPDTELERDTLHTPSMSTQQHCVQVQTVHPPRRLPPPGDRRGLEAGPPARPGDGGQRLAHHREPRPGSWSLYSGLLSSLGMH